jgi:hypothetical protein
MPKKAENNDYKKSTKKEVIEEYESETDSESCSSGGSGSEEVIVVPKRKNKLEKPKEKKPYVMTDARKAAFERAKAKREENIKINKELKQKEQFTKYLLHEIRFLFLFHHDLNCL